MAIFDYEGNVLATGGANYVDVTAFGAKGDGSTDDASAIQDAFDSISSTGGIVYFPVGTYLVSTAVKFYTNQTVWFENGAVIKAKTSAVNNLMRAACDTTITGYNGVHDAIIYNVTFDGSAFNVNNTLFGFSHCKNILVDSCRFVNPYGLSHNFEVNSSYNVHIQNCYFNRGGNPQGNGEMLQIDSATYGAWMDDSNTDGTVSKFVDVSQCTFENNSGSPAIGNHNGQQQQIRIHDNLFNNLTGTRGAIHFDSSTSNVDIYNNTFLDCTTGVGSSRDSYYIHDNRFTGVTTAIAGELSIAHDNMVNGTFIA